MVSLTERLSADVTTQLVVLASLHRVELALVVRAHVVDEIGRHPETGVALGAPVLREVQRRERRRQRAAHPRPGCRSRSHGRRRSEQVEHLVDDRVRSPVDERQRDTRIRLSHRHLRGQASTTPATNPGGHLVLITAVVVVVVREAVDRM